MLPSRPDQTEKKRKCIRMMALNGYYESFHKIKNEFDESFRNFKVRYNAKVNEKKRLEEEIERLQANRLVDSPELRKLFLENASKYSNDHNFLQDLIGRTVDNKIVSADSKAYKLSKQILGETSQRRSQINLCLKEQDRLVEKFKGEIQSYFAFFNQVTEKQALREDFREKDFNETFYIICKSLWNYLSEIDPKSQTELYKSIENALNSTTSNLIQRFVTNSKSIVGYSEYLKFNQLFQELYKYTSDKEVKLDVLREYADSDVAPVPFAIIDDALNPEDFSNVDDSIRKAAVRCISIRYKKYFADESADSKRQNLLEILEDKNLAAVKNRNLSSDVREYAFNWYASENSARKAEVFWNIVELLDGIEGAEMLPLENKIYTECRKYLIQNATDDEIKKNLCALMKNSRSKGLICDFVAGFSHTPAGLGDFRDEKNNYERRIGKSTNVWDDSEWKR